MKNENSYWTNTSTVIMKTNLKQKPYLARKYRKKKKAAKQKRKRKWKIELYSCTMKKNEKKWQGEKKKEMTRKKIQKKMW